MASKLVIGPVLVAIALGAIGLFSVWAQQAWLVPSLGSALFTQAFSPDQQTAKPYPVAAGQVIGVIAGFIAVYLVSVTAAPQMLAGHPLVYGRVLAVAIAALLAGVGQAAAKATSPAGGTAALFVAMGAETPDWAGFGRAIVGIILVTVLGEIIRHVVLRAKSREHGRQPA